jgi:acyl phosphate:glycerol-3-phosphate acyltransferase
MVYILIIITGYMIGSIPTGFIILKKIRNIDITKTGSGNVGTLNSFEITNSKFIGAAVLVIDLLKGILCVLIVRYFIGNLFNYQMTGLIAAVFAHCYSPWLKFKGGRGLATAAGGNLILCLPVLIFWILFWLIIYLFKKNIHFANFIATIGIILMGFTFTELMNKYSNPPAVPQSGFPVLVGLLMFIILTKHISPLIKYLKE